MEENKKIKEKKIQYKPYIMSQKTKDIIEKPEIIMQNTIKEKAKKKKSPKWRRLEKDRGNDYER